MTLFTELLNSSARERETATISATGRSEEANNAPIPIGRIVVPVRGLIHLVERCLCCFVAPLGGFLAATPGESSSSFSPFVPIRAPNLQCAHVNTCIVRLLQAVCAPCTTRDDQHIVRYRKGPGVCIVKNINRL
jgi:hypothetical protein